MADGSTRVTSARRDDYGNVLITFEDGRIVLFEYNVGGFGESTSVGRILIRKNGKNLVVFNGSRQYPINYTPPGFVQAELSLGEIIGYLTTSIDYCKTGARGGPLQDVWREVSKACAIVDEIKTGRWRIPT